MRLPAAVVLRLLTRYRLGIALTLLLLAGARLQVAAQVAPPAWQWAQHSTSVYPATAQKWTVAVAADPAGNTLTAGNSAAGLSLGGVPVSAAAGYTGHLVSYAPNGTVRWTRMLGKPGAYTWLVATTVDATGHVYVAGVCSDTLRLGNLWLAGPRSGPATNPDVRGFLARLDAQGEPEWLMPMGDGPGSLLQQGAVSHLQVDGTGHLVISGRLNGPADFNGTLADRVPGFAHTVFVARLRPRAGGWPVVQWLRTGAGNLINLPGELALDAAGRAYLSPMASGDLVFDALRLPGTLPVDEAALVQYDTTGTLQWARRVPPAAPAAAGQVAHLFGMAVAPDGTGYVLTKVANSTLYSTFLYQLAQYSAQGTLRWRQLLPISNDNAVLHALAADPAGNVYVAGTVREPFVVAGTTLSPTPGNSSDGSLFSFDRQGALRWAGLVATSPNMAGLERIAAPATDVLSVLGIYYGPTTCGPVLLPGPTLGFEFFAGRLGAFPTATATAGSSAALHLAPNPAHGTATLTLPAAPAARAFALLDALGRCVRRYTVPASATTARLDVAGLPAGLYVLHGAGASRKLVVE